VRYDGRVARAPSCARETLDRLEAWAQAWSHAASRVWTAWDGHPLADPAVLEAELGAREVQSAQQRACGGAEASLDEDGAARGADAARARAATTLDALCADVDAPSAPR
jgi:hypothetical protein